MIFFIRVVYDMSLLQQVQTVFKLPPRIGLRPPPPLEMCMEKVVTKASVSHLTALTSWFICPLCSGSESAALAILLLCWFTWFDSLVN